MDLFFLETFKVKHNEENDIEIKEIKEDNDLYFNDEPRIEFFFQDKENGFNYVSKETYNNFLNKEIKRNNKDKKVLIYTRVSSNERRDNLNTQISRVVNFANMNGYKVSKIVKEIGSGFNDNRKELNKILKDLDFDILIIEHKDRLTRVGFNYLNELLLKLNKEIIVVNEVDTNEKDIIQDFISIITSYTSRIYGNRRKNRKSLDFIKELKEVK